jgi:CubicO group peptidase (beta-lactamase class C family)
MSARKFGAVVVLLLAVPFAIATVVGRTRSASAGQKTTSAARPDSASNLVGLWEAKRFLGPEVRGRLVIDRVGSQWRAAIAGRTVVARVLGDTLSFELPNSAGSYTGRFDRARSRISGQWIQNEYATPLTLNTCGSSCFQGDVIALDDQYTFYMKVFPRADGSVGAFLRNPERNLGRFLRVDHLESDGSTVKLVGKNGVTALSGVLRDDVITLYIGNRGGSYDFHRIPDGAFTDFYPRGHPTAAYAYTVPRAEDDGWPVGTLSNAGISEKKISDFVQSVIDTPVDSVGALYLHGLLIARHGKLVLEEYFYGEHGEKPHDTRSASKSVLSVLIGAASLQGAPIGPDTRVYPAMRPAARNLEPRKQALTVEHLLNMASGLDCDDNGEERPGNEDNITQQDTNPDWYAMILDLKTIRDPGEKAVYCSINPHLAGGVLSRITGRPLPDLMWDLVGQPLQMRNYYMWLSPRGDGYMGGGMRFRPRDFMKLGQLYVDHGTWHGRRVVSDEWIKRSTVPRYPLGARTKYGYLWWMIEYPYNGKTVQAYYASGNGGNEVMVIPALDLVLAMYGANYNEAAGFAMVSRLIPDYILPAVAP